MLLLMVGFNFSCIAYYIRLEVLCVNVGFLSSVDSSWYEPMKIVKWKRDDHDAQGNYDDERLKQLGNNRRGLSKERKRREKDKLKIIN